ncbi:MAG: acyltransferase family protein [Gemmatimonadales bacterium]
MAEADPTVAEATRSSLPVRQPALDGVRALAVIGVIASHANLFKLGWIGVDIFFGLSGYLITGILLDAKGAHPTRSAYFMPFYMRRALRILPLAWAVALIAAAIQGQWSGLLWYMGYLVNWLPRNPPPDVLGHYWSLAVEEQFYLVWPAVVLFASRRKLPAITIGVIVLDIVCRFALSTWPPPFANQQFLGLATFARADTLAVGALLAQLERTRGLPARGVGWFWMAAIAAAVAIVIIHRLEINGIAPVLTYNLKWPVIAAGVGAGLLIVLIRPPRFLQWFWMRWIGQISYGVYVIHALFGRPLHARFDSPVIVFVLQLGLTVPLAALSWYFFEAPILAQKHRWPMPSARRR